MKIIVIHQHIGVFAALLSVACAGVSKYRIYDGPQRERSQVAVVKVVSESTLLHDQESLRAVVCTIDGKDGENPGYGGACENDKRFNDYVDGGFEAEVLSGEHTLRVMLKVC